MWNLICDDHLICVGDKVKTFKGEDCEVVDLHPPHKPSSSGKVTLLFDNGEKSTYYVGVINAKFVSIT